VGLNIVKYNSHIPLEPSRLLSAPCRLD